ncbi:major facilitator superfamily domain-containing protein, partial [Desarmillaria tabescens]
STMTSTEEKIIVVSWAGDDDPENPKNWTNTQKWIVTGLISTSMMLSHMSSSMIAPAARDVAKDLGSTSPIFEPLLTSVFILAYGKAEPTTWNFLSAFLYFVSIAHVLGRSRVVQLANVFYIVFNLLCAFAKDPNTMWLCRFFAGIGASCAAGSASVGLLLAIVGAPRGPSRGVALLAIPSLLGPVIGPIVGAWLVMNTTWKWIFWLTSIAAVFDQVGSFFWLKENTSRVISRIYPKYTIRWHSRLSLILCPTSPSLTHMILLLHPVFLLLTEPMIQLLGIYIGRLSDFLTVILTSIPDIFVVVYHESLGIAGLHYIAFGIGLYGGAQIADATQNELYRCLSARYGTTGRPEYRILIILPATLLVTIGLLITGTSQS